MYHSKVVMICWGVIYLAAITAGIVKKRWKGLKNVLVGAAAVAAGIGLSALLNNPFGAVLLSLALLVSAYVTLKGIIQILSKNDLW